MVVPFGLGGMGSGVAFRAGIVTSAGSGSRDNLVRVIVEDRHGVGVLKAAIVGAQTGLGGQRDGEQHGGESGKGDGAHGRVPLSAASACRSLMGGLWARFVAA